MNTKNAREFVEQLITNEQLRENLKTQSSSPEALKSFIKSEGYEFTQAEFEAALRSKFGSEDGSISDARLEEVAGGYFISESNCAASAKL